VSTLPDRVAELIRPEVRAISAYHVAPAQGLIKLDAMESPYPWPGELREGWLAALAEVCANRYPDPEARSLRDRLQATMDVPAGMRVLLGNGSDELIQLVLMAVARPGRVVLAPEPSFVMYRMLALATGMQFVGVPLQAPDFGLDLQGMLEALERHRPLVTFLAYPNNPTGNLFERDQVLRLLAASPGLVVVDEAYTPFADTSFLQDLHHHPNLLVMRTVSKMGLAGLRLGWLAGAPEWLAEINKLRLPYNINVLTQVSAEFALAHLGVLQEQTARIRAERDRLYRALGALPQVHAWSSRANFILFRVPAGCAPGVHAGLLERGVLIKSLHGAHPLLADCLRVTVGTPAENDRFLLALVTTLAGCGSP
jgi:histidinol-phosphate aminotransferase